MWRQQRPQPGDCCSYFCPSASWRRSLRLGPFRSRSVAQYGWVLALLLVPLAALKSQAEIWVEREDAGDLLATAQITAGAGPLTKIIGSIAPRLPTDFRDADIYLIYIEQPQLFSATTSITNRSNRFDSQLFLFNAQGLGIYAHDDISQFNPGALLPAGHEFSPRIPGYYYLAVSGFNFDPISAGGAIFQEPSIYELHRADGPGKNDPLKFWRSNEGQGIGEYEIQLTGVVFSKAPPANPVPEPASLAMCLLFLSMGLSRWLWSRRLRPAVR